jgi:predicted transcriptional regulator
MDLVHVVRHKVLVEERTQRAVARELGLSRTTVGKYMGQAAPARNHHTTDRERHSAAFIVWAGPNSAGLRERLGIRTGALIRTNLSV